MTKQELMELEHGVLCALIEKTGKWTQKDSYWIKSTSALVAILLDWQEEGLTIVKKSEGVYDVGEGTDPDGDGEMAADPETVEVVEPVEETEAVAVGPTHPEPEDCAPETPAAEGYKLPPEDKSLLVVALREAMETVNQLGPKIMDGVRGMALEVSDMKRMVEYSGRLGVKSDTRIRRLEVMVERLTNMCLQLFALVSSQHKGMSPQNRAYFDRPYEEIAELDNPPGKLGEVEETSFMATPEAKTPAPVTEEEGSLKPAPLEEPRERKGARKKVRPEVPTNLG
jgi:hypothetical protein